MSVGSRPSEHLSPLLVRLANAGGRARASYHERWTSDNPGGSPEHFGVVHYGTDPKNLSQTAKSHIRLNPTHSYTDFRVRIEGLQPKTTYYYTVDSMDPRGATDGVNSPVKTFTTQ